MLVYLFGVLSLSPSVQSESDKARILVSGTPPPECPSSVVHSVPGDRNVSLVCFDELLKWQYIVKCKLKDELISNAAPGLLLAFFS